MASTIYSGLIFLLILVIVIALIRKYSGYGTQKVYALGLEGQGGTIKRITELNLIKTGNMLKEVLSGQLITIVTGQVNIIKGKKERMGYIVDMDCGCTVDLFKEENLTTKLKTNPDMIGNVIDSKIIQDAFSIKPSRAMVMVAAFVGIAVGLIMGKVF